MVPFLRCKKSEVVTVQLHRRGPVGVAEHGVEGVSEVVGLRAVVLLRQRQQEGKHHQEEEDELQRQRHPEDAPQETRPASGRRLRVRRGGSGSNVERPVVRTAHRGSRL